jgi:hypothetical protein
MRQFVFGASVGPWGIHLAAFFDRKSRWRCVDKTVATAKLLKNAPNLLRPAYPLVFPDILLISPAIEIITTF